jgi:hypothetical protein
MSALEELLALADLDDPMLAADELDLPALQLAAANERFAHQRGRIPILDRRARDTGIDRFTTLDDLVPVLFSHTTYKSYPLTFLTKGQWDRLLLWFSTVSATSMDGVDLTDVVDVDDWIGRLTAAGHGVFASSGTSGKISFVDQTPGDIALIAELTGKTWGWPTPPVRDNSRPFFSLTPKAGPARVIYGAQALAGAFGRPGEVHDLTDEPIRMDELNKIMRLQQAMASGTATPGDVAEFEAGLASKAGTMQANYERLAHALQRLQSEPLIFTGAWPQCWSLMQACLDIGFEGGAFHPDSIFQGHGGAKGHALPSDYQAALTAFFGSARRYRSYGMSETCTHSPACSYGRYHVPPWLNLLMLDEPAENLLDVTNGPVTGRAAFWDPIWEGHWGGTISGDWMTADFGRCECGRPGPTIIDDVRRAKDVIGVEDDKLSCAGAVEAYIRGAISTGSERL